MKLHNALHRHSNLSLKTRWRKWGGSIKLAGERLNLLFWFWFKLWPIITLRRFHQLSINGGQKSSLEHIHVTQPSMYLKNQDKIRTELRTSTAAKAWNQRSTKASFRSWKTTIHGGKTLESRMWKRGRSTLWNPNVNLLPVSGSDLFRSSWITEALRTDNRPSRLSMIRSGRRGGATPVPPQSPVKT